MDACDQAEGSFQVSSAEDLGPPVILCAQHQNAHDNLTGPMVSWPKAQAAALPRKYGTESAGLTLFLCGAAVSVETFCQAARV